MADGDLLDVDQAEGRLESFIGSTILEDSHTEFHDGGTTNIYVDHPPIKADSIVIVDTKGNIDATDDEILENTEFRVKLESGVIIKTRSKGLRSRWPVGMQRWKVTYSSGLEFLDNWNRTAKRELTATIRDLVSDWYERRIPTATREDGGFGVAKSFVGFRGSALPTVPDRILEVWNRYKMLEI